MSPITPKFHHALAIFLGLAIAAFAADSSDSAAPSAKDTTPAQTALAKLTAERDQLVASLNATTTELAALRARQATTTGQPASDIEKLRTDLARTENDLNEARAAARTLAAKNQQMEDVASERGRALAAAQAELAAKVATVATPAPAVAAPAPDRSGEIEQLTTAKFAAEAHNQELATRLAALDRQIAELTARATAAETKLAAAAPAVASSASAEETEAKLATALRSYAMLQQEIDQTREAAAKTETKLATAQAEVAALRAQVDALNPNGKEMTLLRQASISAATEAVELRDQLRQAQGSVGQLAEENAQLRTRLALLGPPPAPMLASPTRYAPTPPPAAVAKAAPAPSSATSAAKPAAAAPAARQHVVVEGDTLSKISRRYYGTSERWPEILEANRDILRDARNLPMGASLRIP
jgi:nucleoid-associated protein YgaU